MSQIAQTPEQILLESLRKKVQTGYELIHRETAVRDIEATINFINGDQDTLMSYAKSKVFANRVRKILATHCAILTDVRPLGDFTTANTEATRAERVLSKCHQRWWTANNIDRAIRDCLAFSGVGGSGYIHLFHSPEADDIAVEVLDPTKVIPIDPLQGGGRLQEWGGVCIRKTIPISKVHELYPTKKHLLKSSNTNTWFPAKPKGNTNSGAISQAPLFITNVFSAPGFSTEPGVEIMIIYFEDYSRNKTDLPVEMGEIGTNWSYVVEPGERLYPRRRCVICTPETILYDGPNRYWHGKYPVVQFSLCPLPWLINGISIIRDILPLQISLNEGIRGLDDARNMILDPTVIAHTDAITPKELDKIDARLPGGRIPLNPLTGGGKEAFRYSDPPNLGNYYMPYVQYLQDQMDDVAAVRGIIAFLQLRQLPSKDTLREFQNSMEPALQDMSRSLEVSVKQIAEQMLYNLMQFYDTRKRIEILGQEGLANEDFEGSPDIVPDGPGSIEQRARENAKQFTFTMVQGTFLTLNHASKKMMTLQLWSQGGVSTYTMQETFDIPNIGQRVGATEAEQMAHERRQGLLQGSPPELVQAQIAAAVMQAQQAVAAAGMAQQQAAIQGLGGGGEQQMGGGAPRGPGRPQEGIEEPMLESKDGGLRQTVTTSR